MVARMILAAVLAVTLSAAPAGAQAGPTPDATAAQPRLGQKVTDAQGAALGQIEKIISDAQGRPRQVLVSVARVLRVLPLDALTPAGDAYVTVLTREELESLPSAE